MRKIALPKGFKVKDGKVERQFIPRDASHAIRAKHSKKQKVKRRVI